MFARMERGEVVLTATSCEGITYQIDRHTDGSYTIVADGRRLEALYWRAGELDRCALLVEELTGSRPPMDAAA